jgi:hypothetical protein
VAGTTVTEHTGDGTTAAFTFSGYNGTDDGGYLVSVGGIDQPPSKYSISNIAGGTITFVEAPVSGELISIRAVVGTGGGGGSGDATSLRGVDISETAPTDGQVLTYVAADDKWTPQASTGGDGNATQIQGRDVDDTAPTDGQVLGWDDANATWKPVAAGAGADAISLQTYAIADDAPEPQEFLVWSRDNVGTGDYKWRPKPLSGFGSIPTNGQALVYNSDGGWIAGDIDAVKLTGTNLSTTDPTANQALVYNGTEWAPADVNAAKLQGQPVSITTPTTGNLLRFDGTDWVPFNGYAIPNWVEVTSYAPGDVVWYNGKIWNCITPVQTQPPGPGTTGSWVETLGINSGTPSNTSSPAFWLNVQTVSGQGWIPFYQ